MTEDQYILAVRGTLDRQSAAVLSREIESLIGRGYRQIVLFGERLGPVLPDGVLELRRWARQYAEARDVASLPGVAVHSLEGPASAQFLLHGVPVTERRAQILPPLTITAGCLEPTQPLDTATGAADSAVPRRVLHETQLALSGDSAAGATRGWIAQCPACHYASRVSQPGDYACPVCGAPFRMTATGALHALIPE